MAGNQDTYKIIARHFAETIKVKLVFEEDVTPMTDGQTIFLPTEMKKELIDITMGALLHETAHIRMTDFNSMRGLNAGQMKCLNVLEDIRIDHATFELYPNARGFQRALIDSVLDSEEKNKMLSKEPFPIQVLKGMILKANFYDPTKVYPKTVCETVDKFQRFIDDSKKANTNEILNLSIELASLLMDESFEKAKEQEKNGDSGDEGSNSNFAIDMKKYQRLMDEYNEAQNTIDEIKQNIRQIAQEYNDSVDDYKDLRRKSKLNQTQLEKLKAEKNEKDKNGSWSDSNEQEQFENRIKEKSDQVSKISKDFADSESKTRCLEQNVRKCEQDVMQAKQKKQEVTDEKQILAVQMFSQKPDDEVELLGFNALKDQDFTPDSSPIDGLDLSKSLDELIRETIVLKYEKDHIDEEGNKLNCHRLADIYTDYDNLFMDEHKQEKKTQVSFIVDASGSMDGYDYNGKYSSKSLALGALKTLCGAIKRAILNGAPVDFSIHAFGNDVVEIVPSSDDYIENELDQKYQKARSITGYGTNLSRTVTLVNEYMSEKEGDDRIVIILTDACVDERQIVQLEKEAMSDQAKFMFIGLNVEENENDSAWELFGDFNITNTENAIEILEKSLMTLI